MIFIDTWAWLALADRSDSYHAPAIVRHKQLTQSGAKYVTSEYVIGETITYLYRAVPERQAQAFIASLLAAADAATYEFVHVSAHQFRRAWWLRQKYRDKPAISFVDFTSMVVMQDMGINEIFTGDAHFEQVGLGFQLVQ